MPRPALVLAAVLIAAGAIAVFVSSGRDTETLDRTSPMAIFRAATAAVHDADWTTLRTLLTREARSEMERDLTRLKRRLSHPDDGKNERALAQQRLGERAAEEIQRVVDGGPAEALAFYVLLMPRERSPETRGMKVEPGERTVLYKAAEGTLRPVRLVQVHDKWFVADLQL